MFSCRRIGWWVQNLGPVALKPYRPRNLATNVPTEPSRYQQAGITTFSIIRDLISAGQVNEAVQAATSFFSDNPKGYLPPKLLKQFSDVGALRVVTASMERKLSLNATEASDFGWMLKQTHLDGVQHVINTDHIEKQALNGVLAALAEKLLGVQYATAIDIVEAHSGLTAAEVQEQGVLVETVSDIRGDIQSSSVYMNGTVTASIATYTGTMTTVDELQQHETERKLKSRMNPQKYVVLYENGSRTLLPSHVAGENNAGSAGPTRFLRSRIVGISSRTCRCPNCDRQITPLGLTDEDKAHIRSKLGNLQAFGAWLRDREEYEFIVDGANIARFGNMYEFSYSKIESVVDHLTALGKRVLVILPRPPASAKMSAEADRIAKKLYEADMLYETPGQADDHYWLYATVYEGRSQPAFVVSNDYMRDHHDIFPDMKAFMRWRSQHVVYYKLTGGAPPAGKAAGARGRPQVPPRRVELYLPEKLPREIMRTEDSWHVPIVDRDAWLCVNLGKPQHGGSSGAGPPTDIGASARNMGMQILRDRTARRPAVELVFLGQHGNKKKKKKPDRPGPASEPKHEKAARTLNRK